MDRERIKAGLINYALILVGTLITAVGLVLFLVPGRIASGGVSGLAIIIFHLFEVPVGLTILLFNIPLMLLAIKALGRHVGLKTMFGIIFLSFFVEILTPLLSPITGDPLLIAVYGGVLAGFGMGLIFRAGGTTGGTDLIASLINYYIPHISLGQGLFIADALVVSLAGFVFSPERALYAALSIFVVSRLIDFVQEGFNFSKAILIVSEKADLLLEKILEEMDRGATIFNGQGGYSGEDKKILLVTVNRSELARLKGLIYRTDSGAFVILMEAHEVLGEGFKKWKNR
ncbi:MAG: YitT family protein [Halanaerobiales bacterium]